MVTRGAVFLFFWVASALAQNPAAAKHPGAVHYPTITRAEIPLYPPIAWSAHLEGTVEIEVTVEKGAVVSARVKHGTIEAQVAADKSAVTENQAKFLPYLSIPSVANVRTWKFQSEDRAIFVTTYTYRIEGEQTPQPENPKIELDLPYSVKVIARPFKPSCSDCVNQNDTTGVGTDTTGMAYTAPKRGLG